MSELDSLLDVTLDDLADLPEFKPFPVGAHRVLASFAKKEINKKPAVELSFKYIEPVELADPADAVPAQGAESSVAFMLDNEFGQGNFKKCAAPFRASMGFTTIREVVEGVKEVECVLISGLRKDKNDPDKVYLQVKEIEVI